MDGWQRDKSWSDEFLPEIKSILGRYLIAEPPFEEDQQRNTDLIVLKLDAVRIGCRVRKANYLGDYGGEFTIRASRPSGQQTELAKIISGWGDYFFYAFGDDKIGRLVRWGLGDLKVFRLWFNSYIANHHGEIPGSLIPNRDRSSKFRAFEWTQVASPVGNFVVASEPA